MKKISALAIAFGVVVQAGMPLFALAQTSGNSVTSTAGVAGGFCSSLSERLSNIEQRASSQLNSLSQDEDNRRSQIDSKWSDFTNTLQSNRTAENADLERRIQKLELIASSSAAQQAIANFNSALQAALQAKRSAIDAALQTFHQGLLSLLSGRKSVLESAFTARLSAFRAAAQKGQSDCAAGVSAKTVRSNFLTALRDAQSKFAEARRANDSFSTGMQKLVDAKNAALKKAQSDFQTAIRQARDTLKSALGKPQATSTQPTSTSQ